MLNKEEQPENLLTFNHGERPSFLQNNSYLIEDDKTPVNFFKANDICLPSPVHHTVEDERFSALAKFHLLSNKNNAKSHDSSLHHKTHSKNEIESSLNTSQILFEKSEKGKIHTITKKEKGNERNSLNNEKSTVSNVCTSIATPMTPEKSVLRNLDPFQTNSFIKETKDSIATNTGNNSMVVKIFFN